MEEAVLTTLLCETLGLDGAGQRAAGTGQCTTGRGGLAVRLHPGYQRPLQCAQKLELITNMWRVATPMAGWTSTRIPDQAGGGTDLRAALRLHSRQLVAKA